MLNVYQVYDQERDTYSAYAAESLEHAAQLHHQATPLDLQVDQIWPAEVVVEGDDIARFPEEDWQYEVANGDTRLGYAAWLADKLTTDWTGL